MRPDCGLLRLRQKDTDNYESVIVVATSVETGEIKRKKRGRGKHE